MTRSYRTLSEINPELLQDVMRKSEGPMAPEESTSGIMGPPSRFAGRDTSPVPIPEDNESEPTRYYESIVSRIFDNSDNPERVSQALMNQSRSTPREIEDYLNQMESLPPLEETLGVDQTRQALGEPDPVNVEGSTRGPVPVTQQQEMPTQEASTEWNATTFTRDILGRFEGTEAHASNEGGPDTAAYGVKYSLGLNRDDYESDLAFAAAVAQKHYDMAASTFSSAGRNLSELPSSVQNAIVDIHYNNGTIGSTAEKDTPVDMMRNTLDFIGATTADGTRGSLIALARRRAENWNNAANDLGVSRISSIEQIPTDGGTEFRYLDADGNVVHRTTTSRTPITFTGGTSYRVNTETRRVELD